MSRITLPLAVTALLFGACSFAPDPVVPARVAEMPASFSPGAAASPDAAAGGYRAVEWWHAFNDPVLNAVADSALASNFDLAEAVARLEQARARAGSSRAAFLPAVGLSASSSDQDTPANAGFGAQLQALGIGGRAGTDSVASGLPERLAITTHSVAANLSYELDFWGRVRNDALAAGSDYLASESDLRAARIGVLAETITAYFDIVALRRQTALAEAAEDVLLEKETQTANRYGRGLATPFQLHRLRQDLRSTQAALAQRRIALAGAEGRLAVLLGRFPGESHQLLPDSLAPGLPSEPVPAGVPARLLVQRPDVLAAWQRLEGARYRIGARRAERLPSLSISGSIGLQSSDASGVFNADQWFRNLAANLTAPIFQSGRLANNVEMARGAFRQAAAAYGRAVVTAVHEVERALVALEQESQRHRFVRSQLAEARASAQLRARRYASGVGDYIDYLDALVALTSVQSVLAGAERDVAVARLALHRALGGAWTEPDDRE